MQNRPPVVAYYNGRLILMQLHEDCVEYKCRAFFGGYIWRHTALVYTEGGVWFVLCTSQLEAGDLQDRFEAEAFPTKKDARNYAFKRVASLQGRVVSQ
jgi:hypothetical protein